MRRPILAPVAPSVMCWLAVAATVCGGWAILGWVVVMLGHLSGWRALSVIAALACWPLVVSVVRYPWTDAAQSVWASRMYAWAMGLGVLGLIIGAM